jgi:hypothetical protein
MQPDNAVIENFVIASGTGWTGAILPLRGPKTLRLMELKARQPAGGTISDVTYYLAKGIKTATFATVPDAEESAVIAVSHNPTASDTVSSLTEASAAGHVIRLKNDTEYAFLVVNRAVGTGALHHRIVIEAS